MLSVVIKREEFNSFSNKYNSLERFGRREEGEGIRENERGIMSTASSYCFIFKSYLGAWKEEMNEDKLASTFLINQMYIQSIFKFENQGS